MEIKNKLEILVNYFTSNRGVGHTDTILNGVLNKDKPVIFITGHELSSRHFKSFIKKTDKCVAIHSLKYSLLGHRDPLVIDNEALSILFREALREINEIENKYANLDCCNHILQRDHDRLESVLDVKDRQIEDLKVENERLLNKLVSIEEITRS
jgi:hypothetical protein